MKPRPVLDASCVLLASAMLACSGGTPPPATAEPTPAPSAQASAEPAPAPPATASATAAPAAEAPPADPMLAGLTGDDLDWGKKCLAGEGSYCTKFGNIAELQTKDYDKAYAWYKKGCEASKSKEPVCCMGVGRLTINGQGTKADVPGGLALWESTCSMDLGRDSCSELASAYDKGLYGVKKDAKKAKEIYGKACDLKNETACKKAGKKPPK
jgi:TPR repeat protein